LVEGVLIYAIFRFRGKPGDPEPHQTHGNTTVEIIWTVIPALILAVIAVPTVKAIFETNAVPGKDALTIEVIGHQWWWEFRYPEFNVTTANELHVPLGRTVSLRMGSNDVIHSFWVPQFAAKRDVFANRETRMWFKAEAEGEYPGQCAEFCGIQHAEMLASIEVVPAGEFDSWLTDEATKQESGESDLGEMEFAGACAKCHGMNGQGLIGPPFTGALVSDAKAVALIVRNGRGKMPAVGEEWDDRQMNALTSYLEERFSEENSGG
jgi:cytochrome c oxidase subunit 2